MESPGTGVTDGATLCVLESNLGPLEDHLKHRAIPPAPVHTFAKLSLLEGIAFPSGL